MKTTRQQRRALERENKHWPPTLREVPRAHWPIGAAPSCLARVLRSCEFLVQVYVYPDGTIRLSANRSVMGADGRWDDGISWDELQRLKAEAGYGNRWAVEVYPADDDVVNVGNLRHLWLLGSAPPFAWKRGQAE